MTIMLYILHVQAPQYLSDECQLVPHVNYWQCSSERSTDIVSWTKTQLRDTDRSFAITIPHVWNMLPDLLHLGDIYTQFRRLSKAH